MTPDTCPHCGAEVPPGARVCPGCGADDRTGWSEEAGSERLGIHDPDEFDHDAFVRDEFGGGPVRRRNGVLWAVVAVVLLVLLLAALL